MKEPPTTSFGSLNPGRRSLTWLASIQQMLEREAGGLRTKGDLRGALEKYQAAVRLYPAFLRALILMAQVEEQLGSTNRAFELLEYAGRLYPNDATTQFNLSLISASCTV